MFSEEVWKDFGDGHYQISNFGNVRSSWSGSWKYIKTQVVRDGYLRVSILCDGAPKSYFVHRLVAKAFVPNPENKKFVNHKNGVKTDNRSENLEWCTTSENIMHAYDNGLNKHRKYKIKCVETGQIFNGMSDIERKMGIRASTVWGHVKHGWSACGYNFVLIDDKNS